MNRRFPPLELTFPDSPELVSVRISHGDVRTIGRATECAICLNNQSVSREHAVLRYGDDGLTIEDRKSKHGTKVNGVAIPPQMPLPLAEGDTVLCGPVRIDVDRVYERVRTENLGAGGDAVRTVMLGSRAGSPRWIRELRDLMRKNLAQGEREVAAQTVLRQVLSVTGLERGMVIKGMGEGADGRVSIVARAGGDGGMVSRTVIAAAQDPSLVAQLSQNQSFQHAQSIIGSGVTETVCARVPVRSDEAIFVYCDARRPASLSGDEVAEFVGFAAGLLALVFDGIEYRKLSEMRAHFERAASVQRKLLPEKTGTSGSVSWALESIPAAPPDEASLGTQPSGDIVGIAQRPDGSTLAWIGDVCGHGLGASILMSAAQSWLHAAAGRVEDPAETMAALNEFLHLHTEAYDFASLLVVAIAPDGSVDLCDGGHGHAFRVGADGPSAVEIPADSGGLVVGAAPGMTYRSVRLQLAAGERLVLATDGLGESANPEGVQFGAERIVEALRASSEAARDVAGLLAAVDAFAGGVRNDDLTVLSLSRDR